MVERRDDYAAMVKRRMQGAAGELHAADAQVFHGNRGTAIGCSHGTGEVALVGFMGGDLSKPSEVNLTAATARELATWLLNAAAQVDAKQVRSASSSDVVRALARARDRGWPTRDDP